MAADIAYECSKRGYRVTCFAFYGSGGPIREELEARGIECLDFNYLKRTRFVRRFTYQFALYRLLTRLHPHVVHIHHATSHILGALPARLAAVPRVVMTEHSMMELTTRPPYRRQARRYCRIADAITVVDPSIEEFFLTRLNIPRDKLHYIPNGVRIKPPSESERMQLREDLGVSRDEFLCMYAGRLAAVKDLPTLLAAVAEVNALSVTPLRLMLVGDGVERDNLQRRSHELNLDETVTFLGRRTDVPRLLGAADLFVMSSLSEGLPIVLLEAMAARVPCLATAVGGIPELFAGGAGLAVPAQDPAALARAIRELMSDHDRRSSIAEAGFARVAGINDLDAVVDRYLELFGLPKVWPAAACGSATGAQA